MNKTFLRHSIFLASFVGLFLGIVPVTVASAANDDSSRLTIGMSPVSKKYNFEAGSTTKDFVTITNPGSAAYTVKMAVEPYSVKNASYEADFLTLNKERDLKSWVAFDKTTFRIEPKSSVKVEYSITVPTDATPGGHYGVIFAEATPDNSKDQGGAVQQKSRLGTILYATVKGEYTMGGQFQGIRTPVLQFKSPLKSELDVENSGNSDFAVKTVFAVSDVFGNRKFTEEREYQMLPQSTRKIQLQWAQSPGFGLYQVTVSAKFLDKQTSKTSYVLMAPIAFYMIFALALLIATIFFLQKRRAS